MRLLQSLLFVLTAIIFCAYSNSSSSSEDGIGLYKKGIGFYNKRTTTGYRDAVEQFRQSAKMGNSNAAFYLSFMYSKGQGVTKNLKSSHSWLEKSAVLGNPTAQHDMGNRYQHGIGWAKDQTKSSAWFLKSAKKGHAHAQFDIANSYYYGHGIEKNTDTAITWARRSAAQNVSMAQYNLGKWLSEDKSNRQAIMESNKWLTSAAKLFKTEASKGNKQSAYRLASMYEHGEGVVENHSLAYQKYLDLASQGHLWSQYSLARMYLLGKGVDKDYSEGKRWLTEDSAGGLKAADRLLEKL